MASLAAVRGEAERAARLFGAAAVLAEAIGFAPAWPERGAHERGDRAAARAALGGDAFEAASDAGRRLPREQILAEVEAVLDAAATPAPQADAAGDSAAADGLTPRELEVLRLLVDGWSDKEIAAALGIGRRTVSHHVATIRDKLGAPSRTADAALAVRDRLV